MKPIQLVFTLALAAGTIRAEEVIGSDRAANTIALDETGVRNLRIETVDVEESDFEQTAFALGRIGVLPGNSAIVSSRLSGRVHSLLARPHVEVQQGDELLWIESRQPGDPPPVIKIEAPISGLISDLPIAVGQPVTPETHLMEIVDLETVEAAAAVPEHLAGKLKVGQSAKVRVAAAGDTVFEATLVHLGAKVETATGTLEAAFHIKNPDLTLRPGMRAEFSIFLAKREGVTSVPRAALQGEPSSRFVFVKDFDLPNAFIKSPVVTGEMNDQSVEIISGLLPGDSVVTRGSYSLTFAGTGSISLKEALDAAHGHEHAADGSELTPEKTTPMEAGAHSGAGGHDHAAGGSHLWMYASGVLFVLLIIALATRKSGSRDPDAPDNSNRREAA